MLQIATILYGAVGCVFLLLIILQCGAVRFFFYDTVRCGFFFLESYGAVQKCAVRFFVRGEIVRCGAVRLNRTAPHCKKKPHRKKP